MREFLGFPREKKRAPQAIHHYRQEDQLRTLADLRDNDAAADEIGFINRILTMCALPRTDRGTDRNFVRRNGPYTLALTALNPKYYLPYGTYPRIVFAWVCTEVVRTRSPVLDLGRSFAGFMKSIGVLSSDSGGESGVRTRLKEQMNRLFSCAVLLSYESQFGERHEARVIAEEKEFWWDPVRPRNLSLWGSKVEIGHKLFVEILAHPVPIDLRLLRAMKRSALGIDLLLWLTYRVHGLRKPVFLTWKQLYRQFGDPIETQARRDNFRKGARREMVKILTAWPQLRVHMGKGGMRIGPTETRIRER